MFAFSFYIGNILFAYICQQYMQCDWKLLRIVSSVVDCWRKTSEIYFNSFFSHRFFYCRHSRAYLHALFKSDTAAMHHITIHNIAYQVSIRKILQDYHQLINSKTYEWSRDDFKRGFPSFQRSFLRSASFFYCCFKAKQMILLLFRHNPVKGKTNGLFSNGDLDEK